jgi:hypothetical protein
MLRHWSKHSLYLCQKGILIIPHLSFGDNREQKTIYFFCGLFCENAISCLAVGKQLFRIMHFVFEVLLQFPSEIL